MKKLRISIIGNSVAIRNRPPQKSPDNKNYGLLLEEFLQNQHPDQIVMVNNMGFSRATIINVIQNYDEYIASMPDYFIINIGVSDATTREIPYWFAEILNNPKQSWYKPLFSAFHHYCIKPHRSCFVKLRGKQSWITKKRFRKYYKELILLLQKETNARIIVIPINLANDRIERIVPGSKENYNQYNRIIKSIANESDCIYLKLDELNSKEHYPDGIHYSLEGNKLVAKKLFDLLERDYNYAE
ncbi:MAG: GDSL-type esterase/lipase family protein [Candidatus Tenebribacter davisii]|jgi:lysophospholipase L1-like esterase|nr:GDSL-type esterase/lipase family protein [Candidatus Tenebribacter davisii]